MTASAWTADRIDRLRTLWHEGKTAEQIAAELRNGITRSAVLGKVYRMGLSDGRPERRTRQSPRPRASHTAAGRIRSSPEPVAPSPTVSLPTPPILSTDGLTILTLRRGQCRWPHGDPRTGLVFCGMPVARGAFCAGHAEIAYRTPPGGAASLLALAGLT